MIGGDQKIVHSRQLYLPNVGRALRQDVQGVKLSTGLWTDLPSGNHGLSRNALWEIVGLSFGSFSKPVYFQVDWRGFTKAGLSHVAHNQSNPEVALNLLVFLDREYGLETIYSKARQLVDSSGFGDDCLSAFVVLCLVSRRDGRGVKLSVGARFDGFEGASEAKNRREWRRVKPEQRIICGPISLGPRDTSFSLNRLSDRHFALVEQGWENATVRYLRYVKPLLLTQKKFGRLLRDYQGDRFDGKFLYKKDIGCLVVCEGEITQHEQLARTVGIQDVDKEIIAGHIGIDWLEAGQIKITIDGFSQRYVNILGRPGVEAYSQVATRIVQLIRSLVDEESLVTQKDDQGAAITATLL